jgi:hypothetical protein
MIINDGTGTGKQAKVDVANRIHTYAVEVTEAQSALQTGDAYNWNTGNITLTSAADTSVLYLKNNEERDVLIDAVALGFKADTSGSATDMIEITLVRNPTAGDIITNANNVDINQNRDFASSNTFTGLVYKGATGETLLSGGNDVLFIYGSPSGRFFSANLNLHLAKGDSIGVNAKPRASNTSMVMYAALIGHLQVSV